MAIISKDLVAYVWDPRTKYAYQIRVHAFGPWVHPDLFESDPVSDGRFAISKRGFDDGCLELEFRNKAIYLDRDAFEAWLGKTCIKTDSLEKEPAPTVKAKRGRPKRSGSYEAQDLLLVQEMRRKIEAQPGMSKSAAASLVAEDAVGPGTLESKIKRLVRRYSKQFP